MTIRSERFAGRSFRWDRWMPSKKPSTASYLRDLNHYRVLAECTTVRRRGAAILPIERESVGSRRTTSSVRGIFRISQSITWLQSTSAHSRRKSERYSTPTETRRSRATGFHRAVHFSRRCNHLDQHRVVIADNCRE